MPAVPFIAMGAIARPRRGDQRDLHRTDRFDWTRERDIGVVRPDIVVGVAEGAVVDPRPFHVWDRRSRALLLHADPRSLFISRGRGQTRPIAEDRKSTRLNSSH